jgi:Fur family ferric uptake transcriptional regulator/Fur family peroxide stress response transcriptional regulator
MTNYAEIIKKSGLKATFQRMTILAVLDEMGHATIEEIYESVKKTHPTLSLATVYKNIINMVEQEIITEVPIASRKSKYELKKDDHIHLICEECNSVIDLTDSSEAYLSIRKLSESVNFRMFSAQINIYGICKDCKHSK